MNEISFVHENNNYNNIIKFYTVLYTKVLKHFTMEEQNRIIKLTVRYLRKGKFSEMT